MTNEITEIGLQPMVENLVAPVGLISSNDRTGRLFIVEQTGLIWILTIDKRIIDEPFLDIRNKIVNLNPQYDERGLLGLAFHPNFRNNKKLYIYYSAPLRLGANPNFDHTNIVSEFRVLQGNPHKVDINSEKYILFSDQPQMNHNAGTITFGPDGYLYIPIGDGGGANDVGIGHPPEGNGQNLYTFLGKILRIDIDSQISEQIPYGIPLDNPFLNGEALPEIFAYGLRNPFPITFDASANRLFAGENGQDLWESIDIIVKGGNHGWNIKEGTHCFNPKDSMKSPPTCPNAGYRGEPLIDPIVEFANSRGQPNIGLAISVIGGFVYRGREIPEFYGNYIFGCLSRSWQNPDGDLFIATPPIRGEKMWSVKELRISSSENNRINHFVRCFGQDENLELYVLVSKNIGPTGNTGRIFKIVQ